MLAPKRNYPLRQKAYRQFERQEMDLRVSCQQFEKNDYQCQADAQKALERFNKTHKKALKIFDLRWELKEEVVHRWPRGRRGAKTQPLSSQTFYRYKLENFGLFFEAFYDEFHQKSSIVLISNADEDYSTKDIIALYKGQYVVEQSFRMLKKPAVAHAIYLKNTDRIEALTFLLHVSLLLRSVVQYLIQVGYRAYLTANNNQRLRFGVDAFSLNKMGRSISLPTLMKKIVILSKYYLIL